jgi:FkbM family methyltransferase
MKDQTKLVSRIRACVRWGLRLVRNLLELVAGRDQRFLLVTPPLWHRQVVLDLGRRRTIPLHTRDLIDIEVIIQVFISHDYGLHRLARGEELRAHYRSILAGGTIPLILDCGANSGMAARYFAETYPAAKICCIEPDADNLALARRNNSATPVDFLLAGVGGQDGRASFIDPGGGHWAYRVEECADGSTEILSIDSLLQRYQPGEYTPFIVKMDIEGSEASVFDQEADWLDRVPLLIVELHDWMLPRRGNSRSFLAQVAKRDRDFVYLGENVFSIANHMPDARSPTAPCVSAG